MASTHTRRKFDNSIAPCPIQCGPTSFSIMTNVGIAYKRHNRVKHEVGTDRTYRSAYLMVEKRMTPYHKHARIRLTCRQISPIPGHIRE